MGKTKAEVMELLDALPDDCLLKDVEHALLTRHAIHQAEATGEDCVLTYKRRLGEPSGDAGRERERGSPEGAGFAR